MDPNPPPSSSPSRQPQLLHDSATAATAPGRSQQASLDPRRQYDDAARPATPATPAEPHRPQDDGLRTLNTAPSRRSLASLASLSRPVSAAASNVNHEQGRLSEGSRRPSIRIRPSTASLTGQNPPPDSAPVDAPQAQPRPKHEPSSGNRPRSISQPGPAPPPVPRDVSLGARNSWRAQPHTALPRLTEEGPRPTMAELGLAGAGPADTLPFSPRAAAMPLEPPLGRRRSAGEAGIGEAQHKPQRSSLVGRIFRPNLRRSMVVHPPPETRVYADPRHPDEYNEQLVDWLDIIDPEVQTLSTLTNVQNSLFVPDLGSWVNRRPTYVLSQPVPRRDVVPPPEEPSIREEQESEGDVRGREEEEEEEEEARPREVEGAPKPRVGRSDTISSRLSDSHYAALPHGETLEGWTAAEKWELDDHVRHMMHSRRSKFKRQMKGFGQYVRRPLGFFVTLYATLITLFGLAWVLFLIGWIYVGEEQVYAIHIIDSVLVALFAIMGDGLAPFRAIDTYHMIFIVRYCRIIAKAKKKAAKGLARPEPGAGAAGQTQGEPDKPGEDTSQWPGLRQGNNTQVAPSVAVDEDKPDSLPIASDLEDAKSTVSSHSPEMDYLTPKQRRSLQHHQKKLSKSHSFYKPHETLTHHAFPLGRLVAIIILLDCHSFLQISLGACTWGIDYHHRPFALTTVILCVSITCNLTAGLVIMFGDRKTRKKDVVELLNRQALTGDAIKKVEKKRGKQGQETDNDSERFLTGQNGANN